MRPESDVMLRAIPALKAQLQLNVELASPDLCSSRSVQGGSNAGN